LIKKIYKRKRVNRFIIKKSIDKSFRQIVFLFISLIFIFPMFFMFSNSLKTEDEFLNNKFSIPFSPTFRNYVTAFTKGGSHFIEWFRNTIIIAIIATVITVIFAILIGYIFSQIKFKFSTGLLNLTVSLMVVPPIIMIIPLFKTMSALKMVNTLYGVILIYIGIMLPFSIYVLTSFFRTIDREMIEAALIDGCSRHSVLFRIILPISKPSIITVFVVNSLFCWNELLIAMVFLKSTSSKTLMSAITIFRNRYMTDIPITMAGLSMMTIPMVILYFLGTRFFIKGLTSGALKG